MESGNTCNNNLERDWTKFKESLKMKNKATLDESVGSDWTALMESGNTSNNNLERDWTKFKESLKMTNKATLDYVVKQFF
jgi:hypothetical protein